MNPNQLQYNPSPYAPQNNYPPQPSYPPPNPPLNNYSSTSNQYPQTNQTNPIRFVAVKFNQNNQNNNESYLLNYLSNYNDYFNNATITFINDNDNDDGKRNVSGLYVKANKLFLFDTPLLLHIVKIDMQWAVEFILI